MTQNILMVDDDPSVLHMMGRALEGVGRHCVATDGVSALRIAMENAPDLVLLDAEMPGMSGFQVCKAMKADPVLQAVPVIFVTSHLDPALEIKGLKLGADDFITKPFNAPLLRSRVQARLRAKDIADRQLLLSTIDGQTGLANRLGFESLLDREWRRGMREGTPISLLHIEIDEFDSYTTRYGQPAAARCLKLVANELHLALRRPADFIARVNPQQFVALLPNTPREGAEQVTNRMLYAVEAMEIPHETSQTAPTVTLSIGLSSYDSQSSRWIQPSAESRMGGAHELHCSEKELSDAARAALRAAKQAGHAQAWRLDIFDRDAPALARAVEPGLRPATWCH